MIKRIAKFFMENGIESGEARAEAEFLVCEISGLTLEEIIMGEKSQGGGQNEDEIWAKAKERVETGAPIQHIVGHSYFMGDKFIVNADVLIPRPETEILVRRAIKVAKDGIAQSQGDLRILDIGTGTGCIAIEIGKNLPEFNSIDNTYGIAGKGAETTEGRTLEIVGVDISNAALQIAIKNMEALNQQRRVIFRKSDIFSSIYDDEKFDIIVSNPPYIPILAREKLQNEVKNFDPDLALFAQDKDGVEFYESILSGAKNHLKPKGYVLFELGCTDGVSQSEIVAKIALNKGFNLKFIEKDLSNIDRVICFQLP